MWSSLQRLLLAVSKRQQAFLQLQEMTQNYFQSFLLFPETNEAGTGLGIPPIYLPPPSFPHPGLSFLMDYFGLLYLEMTQHHHFPSKEF